MDGGAAVRSSDRLARVALFEEQEGKPEQLFRKRLSGTQGKPTPVDAVDGAAQRKKACRRQNRQQQNGDREEIPRFLPYGRAALSVKPLDKRKRVWYSTLIRLAKGN